MIAWYLCAPCCCCCCYHTGTADAEAAANANARAAVNATIAQQQREHSELQTAWGRFLKLFLTTAAEVSNIGERESGEEVLLWCLSLGGVCMGVGEGGRCRECG